MLRVNIFAPNIWFSSRHGHVPILNTGEILISNHVEPFQIHMMVDKVEAYDDLNEFFQLLPIRIQPKPGGHYPSKLVLSSKKVIRYSESLLTI